MTILTKCTNYKNRKGVQSFFQYKKKNKSQISFGQKAGLWNSIMSRFYEQHESHLTETKWIHLQWLGVN